MRTAVLRRQPAAYLSAFQPFPRNSCGFSGVFFTIVCEHHRFSKGPPLITRLSSVAIAAIVLSACSTTHDSIGWDSLEQQFDAAAAAAVAGEVEERGTTEQPSTPFVVETEPLLIAEPLPHAADPEPAAFSRDLVIDEMRRLWIRDPDLLLETINAARVHPGDPPLSFLLAIAHAETNGRPLLTSEAGAVGLAQATPSAFLIEEQEGPMFVTRDYVEGMRAYVLKKPLGDAVAIASAALGERRAPPSRALPLIEEARRLSSVGVEEVRLLRPWYGERLDALLAADQTRNEAVLDALERVIRTGDRASIEEFRDGVRRDYRALLDLQRRMWKKYQSELDSKRDRLLVEAFGSGARELRGAVAYNAGEYLARELDARFSPSQSAAFLVRHLERKMLEADSIVGGAEDITPLAAALYNGGAHNVLRMRAGLIESLPETDRYAEKVPATRRRLASAMTATGESGSFGISHTGGGR